MTWPHLHIPCYVIVGPNVEIIAPESKQIMDLTPELILKAYTAGIFPMAEHQDAAELYWFEPPLRAILPLDERFHVPRSLAKFMRKEPFDIRFDTAFEATIRGCAETREATWINAAIRDVFTELHQLGHGHSVEAWQDGKLVGGLYGIGINKAFFAESMFSTVSNASKVCVVKLVDWLRERGFMLCDVQFSNPHIAQFGVMEITREDYRQRLKAAIAG